MNTKNKSYKLPFIAAAILCLLLAAFSILLLIRGNYFSMLKHSLSDEGYDYTRNASYVQRQSQFEILPDRDTDVVFLGDSITARFEWQNYFTDLCVSNRGIDSDVCEGVYNRLHTVVNQHPKKVFIMIGINDIQRQIEETKTIDFYAKTLASLHEQLPDCQIYLQSVLPVNTKTGIDNKQVEALNQKIKELAEANSFTYIDLYSQVVSPSNDFLYTVDGVHPTGEAYQIWMDTISPYVYE